MKLFGVLFFAILSSVCIPAVNIIAAGTGNVIILPTTIGENQYTPGCSIARDDVEEADDISAYTAHDFTLDTDCDDISTYRWRYLLKEANGEYTKVAESTAKIFTAPGVEDISTYFVNEDGHMEARVECDYVAGRTIYSATPRLLSLNLKPRILSIENITKVSGSDYNFFVEFDVTYKGADRFYVMLEEEYDTTLRSTLIQQPNKAHVITGNMSSLFYSWVLVKVINDYGEATETLEFAPDYNTYSEAGASLPGAEEATDRAATKIEVYSTDGKQIFAGNLIEFDSLILRSGLYIKRELSPAGHIRTTKVAIP